MDIKLPPAVVSRYDIARLLREIESLNDLFTQEKIRASKTKKSVSLSHILASVSSDNHLDLTKAEVRQELSQKLTKLKEQAPVIHISFASEPDAIVTEKIILWFRREIDPRVLLTIGVQPSIAAGCVVRTRNNYFDFSLRQHLLTNSNLLIEKLKVMQ